MIEVMAVMFDIYNRQICTLFVGEGLILAVLLRGKGVRRVVDPTWLIFTGSHACTAHLVQSIFCYFSVINEPVFNLNPLKSI